MQCMSAKKSGTGPNQDDGGNWATETLPMSLRKELLERELNKLGFRKATAQGGSSSDSGSSQQHGDSGSSHPQADGENSSDHAD